MASNLNVVAITGNLTKDPETRDAGSTTVTTLRVAVNDRRKQGEEWVDVAGYYTVDVWGQQGENCARFLSRGRPVAVSGRLQWREWQTDDGHKREAVTIRADLGGVQFLGSRDSDAPSEPSEPSSAPASSGGEAAGGSGAAIPF